MKELHLLHVCGLLLLPHVFFFLERLLQLPPGFLPGLFPGRPFFLEVSKLLLGLRELFGELISEAPLVALELLLVSLLLLSQLQGVLDFQNGTFPFL